MSVESVSTIIGAYLLGSVPAAYLVAKRLRGIDLRQYGSGNVGASNVMTVVSKRWGIVVIVFDLVKGMVAVYVAQHLGLNITQQVVVGLAAIIGHNWPVFLRFNGGRGGLTTLGVALILAPQLALPSFLIVLIFALFRQMALGTILAITALPVCSWFLSQPWGITKEPLPLSLGFLAIFLVTVIRRLTVPRAAIAASVSTKELLINRLLFDRDIRDRQTWIHRTPIETEPDKTEMEEGKG
ncbi:glycerol-3-phosphate acyltransferase [Chloroflexota bacterium]